MKYIVPYWEVLALSLTGMMVMAATTPMIAALAVPMLDGALVNKDMESMQLVLLAVIVLFTARGAAGYISTYAINWLGSKLAVDLRAEMFNKLLALPACYYADQPGSNLVSRLTSDITQLVHAVVDAITVMVKDTFAVIGLLGWMLYLNWKLSVPAL
ncbi:MAG: lipid ABC transporter permease/ATP-binding protein, partial [Nitrosospira sp.]|nr:lipid ABC transporter permease/ATP-binding protein [Nitrosospira sp.]